MKHLHALIMAGGSGTRFWPRSRRKVPKQFLSLVGDLPLLAATVKRVSGICPPERTWILTRRDLLQDVQRILPQHPASRIITEPEGRDTAPCLVYGSARVERVDPEARLLVLPSDHVIPETELFLEAVAGALDSLRVVDGLLTFGVLPTYPSTGFGYILREAGSGIPAGRGTCYSVARFREKPDAETARSYLKTGGYYWNAGIFLWHLATFRRSLAATAPDLEAGWERLSKLGPALEEDDHPQVRELFVGLRKISIDFALLEKASNVRVVEATFSWDDVGSWRSLERYRQGDEHGNITEGRVVLEAAGGNTVLASGSRVIALMGVQDLVVVDAPGALLICPKDRVEEIKKLVDQVSDRGWEEVL